MVVSLTPASTIDNIRNCASTELNTNRLYKLVTGCFPPPVVVSRARVHYVIYHALYSRSQPLQREAVPRTSTATAFRGLSVSFRCWSDRPKTEVLQVAMPPPGGEAEPPPKFEKDFIIVSEFSEQVGPVPIVSCMSALSVIA